MSKSSSQSNESNLSMPINLFGIDITTFSKSIQFLILTSLTFIFFLVYGYLQELLFQLPGFAKYTWYLTLVQFFFYSCFATIESLLRKDFNRKWVFLNQLKIILFFKSKLFSLRIPLKSYLLLAFLTVSTMGLSVASLPYLNYPTQVMFKCCKLIPVLIGGILIQGESHFYASFK